MFVSQVFNIHDLFGMYSLFVRFDTTNEIFATVGKALASDWDLNKRIKYKIWIWYGFALI